MRQALPKALVRRSNLTLPSREAAGLDLLRVQTEASSDSEVTRQALRYLEQLVEDESHGISLRVVNRDGERRLSLDQFRDRPEGSEDRLMRRSLILHEQSEKRLLKLQAAIGAADVSAVVRCALRYYETLVRAAVDGAQFFAQLPSGEEYRVRIGPFASVASATEDRANNGFPPAHIDRGDFSSDAESALAWARKR